MWRWIVDGFPVKAYHIKDKIGFFMVQYQEKPNPWRDSRKEFENYFEEWIKSLNAQFQEKTRGRGRAELRKRRFFDFANKHPSVDCELEIGGPQFGPEEIGIQRMRVIHGVDVSYNLTAMGDKSWPGWKQADEFFEFLRD